MYGMIPLWGGRRSPFCNDGVTMDGTIDGLALNKFNAVVKALLAKTNNR